MRIELNGDMEINPCEQSGRESCTYCVYKGICDFEPGVPGYRERMLKSLPAEELLARMKEELQEEDR